MPVNSEIFRIYRHLFYGSPLNLLQGIIDSVKKFLWSGCALDFDHYAESICAVAR